MRIAAHSPHRFGHGRWTTIGASSSTFERLWGTRGLAPEGARFEASRGLQAEAGYGLQLFGGRFTGAPNLGFGMSDGGARDYRVGWRLARSDANQLRTSRMSMSAIRRPAKCGNSWLRR